MVMVRRVLIALAVALVLLALIGVAAWRFAAPPLLAGVIETRAAGAGIDLARVTVAEIGVDRIVLTDLATAGDGVRIDRATVRFDAEQMLAERTVQTVALDGVAVALTLGPNGGVAIPGVSLPAGDGPPADRPPALPLDRIAVTGLTVAAATPVGPVAFDGGAMVETAADGGLSATLDGRLDHASGPASLSADATAGGDGTLTAGLSVSAARLAAGGLVVEGAEVWAAVAGRMGGAAAIDTVDGVISAARIAAPEGAEAVPGLGLDGLDAYAIDTPSLLVSGSGGAWPDTALARARLARGETVIGRAALDLGLGGGEAGAMPERFGLGLSIDLEDAAPLVALLDPEAPATAGASRLVLSLDGAVAPWLTAVRQRAWPAIAADAPATGRLEVDLDALRLTAPGGARPEGRVSVAGDLSLDAAGAALTGTAPWSAVPPVAGPLPPGAAVVLDAADGVPQRLVWRHGAHSNDGDAPPRAEVAGRLTLPLSDPALTGTVDAAVTLPAEAPPALDLTDLTIDGGALPLPGGGRAVVERLHLSGGGTVGDAALRIDGAAVPEIGPILPAAATVEGLRLALAGALAWRGERVTLVPDDCLSVDAAALALGEALDLPEGATLCLAAIDDRPLAALRLPALDRVARLDLAARLRPVDLAGTATGLGAITATLPATTVEGSVDLTAGGAPDGGTDGDPGALDIAWSGGALTAAGPGFAAEGVSGTAMVRPFGAERVTAAYTVERLAQTAARPAVGPLRLTGTARLPAEGPVTAEGTATGAGGALTVAYTVTHDPAEGTGEATVTAEPISFAPGVRQPADVVPALAGLPVEAVTGTLRDLSATIGWGDGVASRGRATLADVSVVAPYGTITNLNGTLTASSLSPLRLPPGQRLTADALAVGLALGAGEVVFGLDPGLRLGVSTLGFDWAGGRLSAEPFAAVLDTPSVAIVLGAEGVDLTRLAEQLPLQNFEATGTLRGRVPVRLTPDTIAIEDARLETAGSGVIRYRPGGAEAAPREGGGGLAGQPTGGVALLMAALENFEYESLVLTLNGRTGEDLTARIEIDGANPDLYDGWPIDLNVDVSGALVEILRNGLRSMSIGGRTREIIEQELNR